MGVPATPGDGFLRERAAMMRESLQKSRTITDNFVSILCSFDHRLSALETDMRGPTQIRTNSTRKAHENIDKTLKAAVVILAQFKSSDVVLNQSNTLLAKAISKLEDEFRQLLFSYSKPVEPERLFDCLPKSLQPSSDSPGQHDHSGGKHPTSNHHSAHHDTNLETAVYAPPTLIPPRVLPLLHDLSLQMVQAGHQQQILKIYRDTRSVVLEESLLKLGVEKLSKEDVQTTEDGMGGFRGKNWELDSFYAYCSETIIKCAIIYLKALNRSEINPLQRLQIVIRFRSVDDDHL